MNWQTVDGITREYGHTLMSYNMKDRLIKHDGILWAHEPIGSLATTIHGAFEYYHVTNSDMRILRAKWGLVRNHHMKHAKRRSSKPLGGVFGMESKRMIFVTWIKAIDRMLEVNK